jgi:hypothetical protein
MERDLPAQWEVEAEEAAIRRRRLVVGIIMGDIEMYINRRPILKTF